ncbi:hypothetical protein RDI58_020152 [Solanum bulbocastanum]|uniref:Uncharacterized protein n=1 Tax=Solanum bulbocastanum TaxID=147425 RepID=A0AAN8TBJ5_SOLBU
MCSLEDGDVVEVFVRHLVDEVIVGPMLIENGSHVDMGESGSASNTRPSESENFNFGVGEDHLNSEDPVATFSTSPHFTTTRHFNTTTANGATADVVGDDDIDVGPAGPDFSKEKVEGSTYSIEDSVEFEAELVGDDDEEEYGSDVHEEVRELRAKKKSFQRREKVPADNEEVLVGEVGPDLGFDETGTVFREMEKGGPDSFNYFEWVGVKCTACLAYALQVYMGYKIKKNALDGCPSIEKEGHFQRPLEIPSVIHGSSIGKPYSSSMVSLRSLDFSNLAN